MKVQRPLLVHCIGGSFRGREAIPPSTLVNSDADSCSFSKGFQYPQTYDAFDVVQIVCRIENVLGQPHVGDWCDSLCRPKKVKTSLYFYIRADYKDLKLAQVAR